MNIAFTDILNLFIYLAGIIGLVRWQRMDKAFYPFVVLIWIGCFNEVISILLVKQGYHTIVNNNIYILIESILVLLFLKNIGLFRDRSNPMLMLIGAYCAIWVLESFAIRKFAQINTYFLIFYASVTVLSSISVINHLLVHHHGSLLKSATFLICIGFVVYFTQSILINSFWLYGLTKSSSFLMGIHQIMIVINLFANILYAVALLWIPRKQPSLLPS